MSDSRAEFEAHMRTLNACTHFGRYSAGTAYRTISVERAWNLWQAARKAALAEAAQHLDDLHASARGQHNYFKFAANELRSLADRSPT